MGVEDFVVAVDSTLSEVKAMEKLLCIAGAIQVESDNPDTKCLQVRGAEYIFEIEVWPIDGHSRVEFSLTVCHPLPALKKFISLLNQNAVLLDSKSVSIMEDLPEGVAGDFHNCNLYGLPEAITSAFALKRNLWRADFGTEEAAVTARDALNRFVIG